MKIEQKQEGNQGRFYLGKEEEPKAEMTYSIHEPKKMVINHTEVSDELKGQGIGYELVNAAVDYAREYGLKILPLCPFAAAIFKKKNEYSDVLFENQP